MSADHGSRSKIPKDRGLCVTLAKSKDPLSRDYDGASLCALARRPEDGGSRCSAASLNGVGLQIIQDWILRFGPNLYHIQSRQ